jgi:hypothetical protein
LKRAAEKRGPLNRKQLDASVLVIKDRKGMSGATKEIGAPENRIREFRRNLS